MLKNKILSLSKNILMILLVVFLFSGMLLLAGCDKKDNEEKASDETSEKVIDLLYPDYLMEVDFNSDSESIFVFRPKYSGYYELTYNSSDAVALLDGNKVESGYEQYFNKYREYSIVYTKKSADATIIHGGLTPTKNQTNQINIGAYDEY
nr:hypothetical protein [Clostridia bacterium]